MKKIIICFISFTLLFCVGCTNSNSENKKAPSYINSKNYNILSYEGIVNTYKLTREIQRETQYKKVWQIQDSETTNKYLNKTIKIHHYKVNNHPLGTNTKDTVNIYIITCKNKIIGSYSTRLNDSDNIYSIEGKSYEDIYGVDTFY